MTEEQFKQLMEKLDNIEREIKDGKWAHLFKPPQPMPNYHPAWPSPHFAPYHPPIITD